VRVPPTYIHRSFASWARVPERIGRSRPRAAPRSRRSSRRIATASRATPFRNGFLRNAMTTRCQGTPLAPEVRCWIAIAPFSNNLANQPTSPTNQPRQPTNLANQPTSPTNLANLANLANQPRRPRRPRQPRQPTSPTNLADLADQHNQPKPRSQVTSAVHESTQAPLADRKCSLNSLKIRHISDSRPNVPEAPLTAAKVLRARSNEVDPIVRTRSEAA